MTMHGENVRACERIIFAHGCLNDGQVECGDLEWELGTFRCPGLMAKEWDCNKAVESARKWLKEDKEDQT